ncbi:MAG: ABC transporter permease [Candidatus Roizmanbacteria bacterium]|nr:ABC transporter permease [Candidatus Roizmanbacteria bacterium]
MKSKIVHIARTAISPKFWKEVFRQIYLFVGFFVLLILFLISKIFSHLLFLPIIGRLIYKINFATGKTIPHYEQLLSNKIDGMRPSEVRRSYLIGLALKNLLAKKTRSFITMFGMAVGIGIIVFLISLGYGIERLVISRIASLDELRMIDVSSSENTSLRLNKSVFDKITALPKIEKVIPIVSIVGKISFGGAQTDVLVYAVPRSYLDAIKVQPKDGKFFTNNQSFDNTTAMKESTGSVAGAKTAMTKVQMGSKIDENNYSVTILPQQAALVSETCDITSKTLGYSARIEGGFTGNLYWGSQYSPFDDFGRGAYDVKRDVYVGKWVKGIMPLYNKNTDDTLAPLLDDMGRQVWKEGCIQERFVQKEEIIKVTKAQVLGESTSSATLDTTQQTYDAVVVASDSSGFEMVSLQASGSAGMTKTPDKLKFSSAPDGTAVVSTGLLNLLGIAEKKAVGATFKSSFIIGKSLLPSVEGKVQSQDQTYTIVGVIDDANSTYFYIPYADMKKLSIPHVSQFKVVLKDAESLAKTRKEIETFGFRTNSTYDTVKQIESLFVSLRVILAVLGLVALGIAALGMFNTLTVSLLERTREIGGMKTMGMVSEEVQDLFIAEAMIMGLSGGIGGLTLGYLVGKGLSLLVSAVALSQGQGYLDLTYIPWNFTVFILITSFIVGVITGLYPAQRAKNISALNALRYE